MEFYPLLLSFLAGAALRSLVLVAIAIAAIGALRLTSAASRHAVLTVALSGMMLATVFSPVLPPVALRVLDAPQGVTGYPLALAPLPTEPAPAAIPAAPQETPRSAWTWQQAAGLLYLLGSLFFLTRLAFGSLFTLRLVHSSRPVEHPSHGGILESSWISVPLTVGWLRPRILLPAGWQTWTAAKLQAVLAHERSHIARADWAISILAAFNRCLFWFNPVAWWLERKLASLAEQACDDASLLQVESDSYAQALLDMAAAVKTGQGRLVWEAMAMAKAAEVRRRIERILDETREIPRALTRSHWATLVACSLPLIYITSVVQLAAQEPKTPAAMAEFLKGRRQLSAADAAAMEQYLTANPHDLDVRSQLVVYYFANNIKEPRIAHTLWLIANHPESDAAVLASQGILPRANPLNDPGEYAQASALWRQQAARSPNDARVLGNAGQFFAQPGGDFEEAERLFLAAQTIDSSWKRRLADLYARAILGATGDPAFARVEPSFAGKVKRQLEESSDLALVVLTGMQLSKVARRPVNGRPLAAGQLNLDDHPLLVEAVDFGERLLARFRESGSSSIALPPEVQRGGQSVPLQTAPAAAPSLPPAPQPVSEVDPEYPPLARQARIQGVVKLGIRIGEDGRVTGLELISGHPLLVQSTLESVRQWMFPTGSAGQYQLVVPFRLDGGNAPLGQDAPLGQAPPVPPSRIKVGGNVQQARIIDRVEPVYPPLVRQARISGEVTLEVLIGKDGRVESTKPLAGHPLLVGAAQDAVRQWIYQPTPLNSTPVSVTTTLTLNFEEK